MAGLCRLLSVPISSWTRIRLICAKSVGCRIKEVTRDAWLRRDLGFD
jgi:hypothetical protein